MMQETRKCGEVRWAPTPAADRVKHVPIISPRPHQTLYMVITTEQVMGVETHWIEQRTTPCMQEVGDCRGCTAGLAKRWKGYLGGADLSTGRLGIIEVTLGAWEHCPRLQERDKSLRGLIAKLYRRGTKRNSPAFIELQAPTKNILLPPFPDLARQLRIIWGLQVEPYRST